MNFQRPVSPSCFAVDGQLLRFGTDVRRGRRGPMPGVHPTAGIGQAALDDSRRVVFVPTGIASDFAVSRPWRRHGRQVSSAHKFNPLPSSRFLMLTLVVVAAFALLALYGGHRLGVNAVLLLPRPLGRPLAAAAAHAGPAGRHLRGRLPDWGRKSDDDANGEPVAGAPPGLTGSG